MTAAALDPAVRITLRAGLSLLFVWSASHKLRNAAAFREALADYQLVPDRWLTPTAALLVVTEFGIALGLWLPGLATAAACTAAGLLALYAGAIAINLLRGRRDIDCGCGGVASHQPLSSALVIRNGLLAVAALVSGLPVAPRALTWIDDITVVASCATLGLLYAALDGLLANAPHLRTTSHSPRVSHA